MEYLLKRESHFCCDSCQQGSLDTTCAMPSVVSCFPANSHVGCNVLMLASAQDSNTDKLETIPQALPNELQAKKYMYTLNYNKIQYNLSNVTHLEVNIILKKILFFIFIKLS